MFSYIPVDPSQIEQELEKLEETHKQNNQLRASLFNLIVYAHKGQKLPYFVDLADQIVKQFPCRILFIEENTESTEPYLKSSIAAKLVSEGDNPNIVCDKIYLETSKDNTEQIYHLVLQHVIIDLPIYLLWGQDPTLPHPLFNPLKHLANRLVFHSECSNNLQTLSKTLLDHVIRDHWEVADLNWVHLQDLREVIKATFNSKEAIQDLEAATEITLKFCGAESEYFCHNHFQVHYMHAWLAGQLNWQFLSYEDHQNEKRISYQNGSEQVKINILEEKCSLQAQPGMVVYFQIKTRTKKSFVFSTSPDQDMIHIEILDEEKRNTPYNASVIKPKWALFLAKEICYNETSAHYINTLKVLAQIDGLK